LRFFLTFTSHFLLCQFLNYLKSKAWGPWKAHLTENPQKSYTGRKKLVWRPGVDFIKQFMPYAQNLRSAPILFCTNLLWFGIMHLCLALNLMHFFTVFGALYALHRATNFYEIHPSCMGKAVSDKNFIFFNLKMAIFWACKVYSLLSPNQFFCTCW
jgi:hypothetical protein